MARTRKFSYQVGGTSVLYNPFSVELHPQFQGDTYDIDRKSAYGGNENPQPLPDPVCDHLQKWCTRSDIEGKPTLLRFATVEEFKRFLSGGAKKQPDQMTKAELIVHIEGMEETLGPKPKKVGVLNKYGKAELLVVVQDESWDAINPDAMVVPPSPAEEREMETVTIGNDNPVE